ncbi:hypothetical protein QE250_10560 [Chromatiaceae bacterium AAb-1]|nr:hypothetical protein [Chromatiaceae bacterium AAb-1]
MRLLYLFLLVCALLAGCKPSGKSDESTRILLDSIAGQLVISPEMIPVETPLTLSFYSAQPLHALSAEITGVSMYMGKIPLRFMPVATDNRHWQAVFLLGACADPEMQWQLELVMTYADGKTEKQLQLFHSSW